MDAVTLAMIKGLGNGGSSLPSVTSSDNGKVLAVKDGAWAADSNLFVVNVVLNQSYVLVADKTYAEISAAIDAGKQVVCVRDGTVFAFASKTPWDIYFSESHPYTTMQYIVITSSNSVSARTQYQLSNTSAQNNGSEMIVKNGAWTMQKKKFLVTLTPTSPDYSGTMDKTVAEINAAYEAGQQIVFRVMMSATEHMDVDCTASYFSSGFTYPSFNAYIVSDSGVIIYAFTGATNDGTRQTYSTKVYSLTPAS